MSKRAGGAPAPPRAAPAPEDGERTRHLASLQARADALFGAMDADSNGVVDRWGGAIARAHVRPSGAWG